VYKRPVLRGGAGDDVLTGGAGNDRLTGGLGFDRIAGGPGNDRIDARDGKHDRVDCGAGRDTAFVDPGDTVNRNCELVHRA
jgi:Ca2+-binding RTX toxin-like protein